MCEDNKHISLKMNFKFSPSTVGGLLMFSTG